jgi:Protein of unknown function (DUF1460)
MIAFAKERGVSFMNLILWFLLAVACHARADTQDGRRFYQLADERQIARLLEKDLGDASLSLDERIDKVSERFLGTPYKLGPLGEGPQGQFQRKPLIDFKEVDCTTLVEQVMALAIDGNLDRAIATLQKIRYKNGDIRYESRNHFPEADWIPNNIAAGYLRDITRQVAGDRTRTVTMTISKSQWYAQKTEKDLVGFDNASPQERTELVKRWRNLGKQFPDQKVSLEYLPIEDIKDLLRRIPSGTIGNLVRDPETRGLAPVIISHQFFIIDGPDGKVVRHAAYGDRVKDIPALEYFAHYANAHWRLLGLNLNEVRKP